MNVLVLAPHPFFQNRGTPIAVRAVVEALAEAGHVVDVLTFHEGEEIEIPGGGRLQRIPALPGVHGIRPGFSFKKLACDAALAVKCLGLVRERRYDLLHAVEESAFIALAVKKLYGIPFLYDMDSSLAQQMMERFGWLRRFEGFLTAWERAAVRGSVGVVAVCKSLEETARAYQADKPVLRLEDFSLLEPGPDGAAGAESLDAIPRPRAMYVGNLEPYQGIDLLLESFRVARERGGAGSLVVVGGKPEDIARYRDEARRLGIEPAVFFLGPRPVDRLAAYLKQADVLVSPRIQGTNTPMKIYSYLDSGRPVLATRLLTHTQVLDDEIAELAAPEPAAMGAALLRLFEDPGHAARLARQARERVAREFTVGAFRRKLTEFYGEVERGLARDR